MRKIHTALVMASLMSAAAPVVTHAQSEEVAGELEAYVGTGSLGAAEILPTQPIDSVFGPGRTILDTPRSVTVISSDLITAAAVRNSEDLARLAPSTYSNFRFGLQGGLNIRGQAADYYIRGMKIIDPQGNYRTLYNAVDSLEIVRGFPSALYGLGRIGGYVNLNPKTSRLSKTGKYLEDYTGQVTYTHGSYDKNVATAEVGGPAKIFGLTGGFHVYYYWENSDSFYANNFDRHNMLQSTLSLDLTDTIRLETGVIAQRSYGGLPGGINRSTPQTLVDGTYWDGTFRYEIDLNGDKQISDFEQLRAYFPEGHPRFGEPQTVGKTQSIGNSQRYGLSGDYIGQQNNTFFRRYPLPENPGNGGKTVSIDEFKQGYFDPNSGVHRTGWYPLEWTTKDSKGNVTGQGTYFVPLAWELDIDSWNPVNLADYDYKPSFGEDFYKAYVFTGFFDVIHDVDPDFVIKNQTLAHHQDQIKQGRNPFSQHQDIFTFENKTTLSHLLGFIPFDWMEVRNTYAASWYYYDGGRDTDLSVDIDFRRSLVASGPGVGQYGFTSKDTFFAFNAGDKTDQTIMRSTVHESRYMDYGLGVLSDITMFDKLSVIAGGRMDYVYAEGFQPANVFARNGNGTINPNARRNKSTDVGYSYNVNVSYKLPFNITPYFAYGKNSGLIIDTSSYSIPFTNTGNSNIISTTFLREAGVKTTLLEDKLYFAGAVYEQSRVSFDSNTGGIDSVGGEGIELELRWLATEKLSFVFGASWSKNINLPVGSVGVSVDGRFLGYPDIVDSTGKVVIPAEAFTWGGRPSVTIQNNDPRYQEVEGYPHRVISLTSNYQITKDWRIGGTVYHQGSYSADRVHMIKVPEATVLDLNTAYTWKDWQIQLNVTNVFDKLYFNKGAFYWLHPRMPRSYEVTLRYNF